MRELISGIGAFCLLLAITGRSQAAPEYANLLEPLAVKAAAQEKASDTEGWGKRIAGLVSEVKKQRDVSVQAGFGFSGDEAGSQNLYKVSADMNLSKGVYPTRVVFMTATDVTYENDKLKEQVRSMLVNFDYHFVPPLESYGFLERFTDTFMGIDDRYEIGGGLKFEWEDLHLAPKGKALKGSLETLSKTDGAMADAIKRLGGPQVSSQLMAMLADRGLPIGISKRHSRLKLGLAATLFMELEQASVETFVDTLGVGGAAARAGSKETKVDLPSETQLRWVMRPSLEFHPTDVFTLKALTYLKYPLRHTRRNGRLDYRVDSTLRAELKLEPDQNGEEKVALIWEVKQSYDNTPPEIPGSQLLAEAQQGLSYRRTVNEKKHQSATFKLEVSW